MTNRINTTRDNMLWEHKQGARRWLQTVCVKSIEWLPSGESVVVLEGFLQKDRFLLDIANSQIEFEVRCSHCYDPNDYNEGKKTLMWMRNLRDFSWWSHDVMSTGETMATRINCQFTCDWIEICDS